MYICNECELVFSRPKTYREDRTPYGGPPEHGFIETYSGCPSCGGHYEEVTNCTRCNEYISVESSDPFCSECVNELLSVYAETIKNIFREDEYDTILNHLDDVEPFKEEE